MYSNSECTLSLPLSLSWAPMFPRLPLTCRFSIIDQFHCSSGRWNMKPLLKPACGGICFAAYGATHWPLTFCELVLVTKCGNLVWAACVMNPSMLNPLHGVERKSATWRHTAALCCQLQIPILFLGMHAKFPVLHLKLGTITLALYHMLMI